MSDTRASTRAESWRLQSWLKIGANDKPQVYNQVFATAEINSLTYWLEIIFAAGIATFGLVESSPAVIIGAMLISPLMGPIMATGLALAVGDIYLGLKAGLNLAASVAVSIAFSGLLVWLLPFHSATSEIVARTNPNLLDLGIALLSGLAGSVVVSRGAGRDITTLPGVAIAVALMPPLSTIGFGLGSGLNQEIMSGAGLLFLTNLVAIVAAAFLVFLLVGMSTPEVEQAMVTTRERESLARIFEHGPIKRMLAAGGRLRWRVLMVLILLGSIAVPLRRALLQVASEAHARVAVQSVLKKLVPSDAIVSQQVSVGNHEIAIHLISTRRIPDSEVTEARRNLIEQTGYDVQLSAEAVASKRELADLMERLARPAPIIPKEKTVAETQEDLRNRVELAIKEIWPSTDAPIQDFDVALGASGVTINVRYRAAKDLDELPVKMVLQSLRATLEMPDLSLKTERIQSPAAAKKPQ